MPQKTIQVEIEVDANGAVLGLTRFKESLVEVGQEAPKAEKSLKNFTKEAASKVLTGALEYAGRLSAELVGKFVELGKQSFELGVRFETASKRLEAFAGGSKQAQEYISEFLKATDYAVDRLSAAESATRLLQMGLVSNSEEMAQMAAIAVKLGDQTMEAGDRISDFALLLSNQSVMRLDNFGISSGRVRERIKELQETFAGMQRDEAFKLAVLEEGSRALQTLGDTSETTKSKLDRVSATIKDTLTGLGSYMVDVANDFELFGITLDNLPEKINQVTTAWTQLSLMGRAAATGLSNVKGSMTPKEWIESFTEGWDYAWRDWARKQGYAVDASNEALHYAYTVINETRTAYQSLRYVQDDVTVSTNSLVQSDGDLIHTILSVNQELNNYKAALGLAEDATWDQVIATEEMNRQNELAVQRANELAQTTGTLTLNQQMRYKQFFETVQSMRTEHATTIEEIEANHQARVIELQASGNAELLAQEEARYQEELLRAQQSYEQQLEMQRQALGQMILQTFDAWVQMNGGVTAQTLEMRTRIAEEYGLVEEGTSKFVDNFLGLLGQWKDGSISNANVFMALMNQAADSVFNLGAKIRDLPSFKEIKIKVTHEGGRVAYQEPGGPSITEYATGGSKIVGPGYGGPMTFIAGEGTRPEMVTVQNVYNRNVDMSNMTVNDALDASAIQALVVRAIAGAI